MDLNWTDRDLAFQDEVRDFFEANLTPEIRRAGSNMSSVYADHDFALKWQLILHKKGWAAPAWPVEYGGCNWSVIQHYIFAREYARAGAPPVTPMGFQMAAPAIIYYGTAEQKAFFLPRILNGEHFWCQGYSEPNAGSDLASLQMPAVEDGDDLICNGSKIWSTHAAMANWMFCLVRTSNESRVQQGITFLLIDMKTPGITVRPIVMGAQEAIQSEVFFENVRVPKANVLGEIGKGWSVAKYLLDFERGGVAYAPAIQERAAKLSHVTQEWSRPDRGPYLEDTGFKHRLAEARIRIDVLEAFEFRVMSALQQGEEIRAAPSMMKILGTELSQHLTELSLEAAGPIGAAFQPQVAITGGPVHGFVPPADGYVTGEIWEGLAPLRYLNERAGSIYAGSNEIQRNIIAKLTLSA